MQTGESGRSWFRQLVDLADAIQAAGYDVERKQFLLPTAPSELGAYECTVKLHKDVVVTVKFEVVAE